MSLRYAVAFVALLSAGRAGAAIDFERDVRPILAGHCTKCHGGVRAKAGLSFVRKESAFGAAESGLHPIVAGDAGASELIARVASDDGDERMPPEEPLSAPQIDTLRQWIDDGAHWPEHWAFGAFGDRADTSIDRIVGDSLADAGLAPSPQAPGHVLIRRLWLDLLGLPPSPEEAAAFAADERPGAYQRLVDKALSSPHFGERWARHWLDGARYADSDGYEKDNARPDAWRWRKWVIDAINADMPFDQFTIEQLAGDLLPGATPEQRLATAFHRQTLFNREGGVDPEEDRTKRTIDRANTTASVWLGLTAECAQCHDHPYDPITQREFYQLYAFFNDASEGEVQVSTGDADELSAMEDQLEKSRTDRATAFATWLAEAQRKAREIGPLQFLAVTPEAVRAESATLERQDDSSYFAKGGDAGKNDRYHLALPTGGRALTGIRVEVMTDDRLPKKGPGRSGNGNFVLSEIKLLVGDEPRTLASAKADFSQDGWDVGMAIDGDPSTGWAVSPKIGKGHHAIFTLGAPLKASSIEVVLEQLYAETTGKGDHHLGRFRVSLMTGGEAVPGLPDELAALLRAERLDDRGREQLEGHYFAKVDAVTAPLAEELASKRATRMMKARVMRAGPRTTYVFHRGDFLRPEKELGEVVPGTPGALPAMDKPEGRKPNRLDLAHWIVDPRNPLTARVAANDIWTRLIGAGLVDTKSDWGTRCAPPLHPDLLDHLAAQFVAGGWSRKALIRQIVMSQTYRQSAHHRAEASARDPSNQLFHRQNRFRLEGEILRDVFLSASGLLEHKIGSPSVFPPIPPDIAALSYANNFKWKTSEGADRYRRGMYTFFKRTAADPNLLTFDCPDANVSVVERNVSNTPIMALATLGNEVFHEASQALAERLLSDPALGDDTARIRQAFLLCVGRPPSAMERGHVGTLLQRARRYYQSNAADAKALTEPHRATGADPAENAAWVAAARAVLNLDETLTRP